jgi:hypothetical protein
MKIKLYIHKLWFNIMIYRLKLISKVFPNKELIELRRYRLIFTIYENYDLTKVHKNDVSENLKLNYYSIKNKNTK